MLTREVAADASIIVENAQRVIREAFRFLTEGPEPRPPASGSAWAQTLKELASYQDAPGVYNSQCPLMQSWAYLDARPAWLDPARARMKPSPVRKRGADRRERCRPAHPRH